MKRLCLRFAGLVAILSLSMAGAAKAGDVTVHFAGVTSSSQSDTGVYTGIYYGTLGASSTTTNFICDDPLNEIKPGQSWQANSQSVSTVIANNSGLFSTNPTGNQYLISSGLSISQAYIEAAWLAAQLLTGQSHDYDGVSVAIWEIMDHPGSHGVNISAALQNDVNNLLAQALAAYNNGWQPIGIAVLTPTADPANGQEFFYLTAEPLSMILMGTFLSLAGGLLAKKKLTA
jgi:hypothetical protein